jgi:GT2 family glycosyltransferase
MRNVVLVVVHYRTPQDTLECLESIVRLAVPYDVRHQVVVVENGSEDESWRDLLQWRRAQVSLWSMEFGSNDLPAGVVEASSCQLVDNGWEITMMRAADNRGYAAGANLGMRFGARDGTATDFWVLNSDLILDPESLRHLLRNSEGRKPAIYGATLLYVDDPSLVQAAGGAVYLAPLGRSRHFGKRRHLNDLPEKTPHFDYIVGAALFFPRRVLEEIGYLPEDFFIYFEETEWAARARARHIELVWVREARLIHKEGRSTGASARFRRLSDLSFRYVVRNSLLFTETRYPFWLTTVLLFNLYECIRHLGYGDFGKARVFVEAVREYWALRPQWAQKVSGLEG